MLTIELVIELEIIFTTKMMKKVYTNNILLASHNCSQQQQEYSSEYLYEQYHVSVLNVYMLLCVLMYLKVMTREVISHIRN